MRHVVIVAYEGVQPLDVVGPHEVFAGADASAGRRGRQGYRVTVAAAHGPEVRGESGLRLVADPLPHPSTIDTLILPGGDGVHEARRDPVLMAWLRVAAPSVRRLATVCSGTFLGAETGLLDGRTVTTHWARAQRLAEEFPALTVDPDPIYRRDGDVWTSAGVTAGIDLALALVEDDHGAEVAQLVARWLVMFRHRPGGQSQYATSVWTRRADRRAVRAAQEAIEADPAGDHRVPVLADAAAMSARHFTRVFAKEVGEPPAKYVERVRVEAAREALESTDATLDAIATSCGFGTAETLRRAFHRRLGVAPDSYRQRFKRPPQRVDPYEATTRHARLRDRQGASRTEGAAEGQRRPVPTSKESA
ncbi:MAG: GlxA family transcriptional regulator [Ilumatobacteraceae bacterium]